MLNEGKIQRQVRNTNESMMKLEHGTAAKTDIVIGDK